MKRKYLFLIITAIIIALYILLRITNGVTQSFSNAPEITFNQNELTISVKDQQDILLSGVKAYDKEDGDISEHVVIESISPFISGTTRKVNYLVFDSDDHVTKASRTITYTDYKAPVFSLTDQLRASSYSLTSVMNKIKATSSVDGDISSKITSINTTIVTAQELELQLSVTDSTNTSSYLNVKFYLEADGDIDIKLSKYLVYLKQGQTFNYRNNIKNIIEKNMQDNSLSPYVKISIPEMNEPGVYEVTYSLERANGNKGKTTMIVIVE